MDAKKINIFTIYTHTHTTNQLQIINYISLYMQPIHVISNLTLAWLESSPVYPLPQ